MGAVRFSISRATSGAPSRRPTTKGTTVVAPRMTGKSRARRIAPVSVADICDATNPAVAARTSGPPSRTAISQRWRRQVRRRSVPITPAGGAGPRRPRWRQQRRQRDRLPPSRAPAPRGSGSRRCRRRPPAGASTGRARALDGPVGRLEQAVTLFPVDQPSVRRAVPEVRVDRSGAGHDRLGDREAVEGTECGSAIPNATDTATDRPIPTSNAGSVRPSSAPIDPCDEDQQRAHDEWQAAVLVVLEPKVAVREVGMRHLVGGHREDQDQCQRDHEDGRHPPRQPSHSRSGEWPAVRAVRCSTSRATTGTPRTRPPTNGTKVMAIWVSWTAVPCESWKA